MDTDTLLVLWWAVIIFYFATPVYVLLWMFGQKREQRSVAPGIKCLLIWAATLVLVALFAISGAGYQEHTSIGAQIIGTIIALTFFVAHPIASMIYLHLQARKGSGQS